MKENNFSFSDAYNLPTYLRKFYIRSISEDNRKAKEEMEKKAGKEDLTYKKFPKSKKTPTKSQPYISKPKVK